MTTGSDKAFIAGAELTGRIAQEQIAELEAEIERLNNIIKQYESKNNIV